MSKSSAQKNLIARINRRLAHDGKKLVTTRSINDRLNLGDFHAIDVSGNFVIARDVSPEELGRQLGVAASQHAGTRR